MLMTYQERLSEMTIRCVAYLLKWVSQCTRATVQPQRGGVSQVTATLLIVCSPAVDFRLPYWIWGVAFDLTIRWPRNYVDFVDFLTSTPDSS